MSYFNSNIPQAASAHYPNGSPYRDRLGLVHGRLTAADALEIRNYNLQRYVTELLTRNATLNAEIREREGVRR